MKFLKNFGLGLVVVLLLPLFLAGLAIFAIVLFFVYFKELFENVIRFFRGEKGLKKLPEDLQVDAIKEESLRKNMPSEEKKETTPVAPPPPTNVYIQQNYYTKGTEIPSFGPQNKPSVETGTMPQIQNNYAKPGYFDYQTSQIPAIDEQTSDVMESEEAKSEQEEGGQTL